MPNGSVNSRVQNMPQACNACTVYCKCLYLHAGGVYLLPLNTDCRQVRNWYYLHMLTTLQKLETLSVPERVQIVEDIWDSIARSNANLPVPQWQKDELSRRQNRHLQNPDSGDNWDQVKRSILQPR